MDVQSSRRSGEQAYRGRLTSADISLSSQTDRLDMRLAVCRQLPIRRILQSSAVKKNEKTLKTACASQSPRTNMRTVNIGKLDISLGDAIYSLRAIRRLREDPISDEDLRTILDAARQAPNGANQQDWHFVVIRDAEAKRKFGTLYREAWWAKRNGAGYFKPEDLPDHYRSAMGLADTIGGAPAIVLVCATQPGFRESVIPATQNMLLAARGLGIGGTITTLHPSVSERVGELLKIPGSAVVVYCVPLGYPQGQFGPVTRKPLIEIVSEDAWGRPPAWA